MTIRPLGRDRQVTPSCNMVQGAPAALAFLGAMVTWYL